MGLALLDQLSNVKHSFLCVRSGEQVGVAPGDAGEGVELAPFRVLQWEGRCCCCSLAVPGLPCWWVGYVAVVAIVSCLGLLSRVSRSCRMLRCRGGGSLLLPGRPVLVCAGQGALVTA